MAQLVQDGDELILELYDEDLESLSNPGLAPDGITVKLSGREHLGNVLKIRYGGHNLGMGSDD